MSYLKEFLRVVLETYLLFAAFMFLALATIAVLAVFFYGIGALLG